MKNKKILITGATDGIGLATAKILCLQGHSLLVHGRNSDKLATVKSALMNLSTGSSVTTYLADLSTIAGVNSLITNVMSDHSQLDVLINNAGVFKVNQELTEQALDIRFIVNTLTPYLLTKALLPLLKNKGRVVNVSSAAQAPVNINALKGKVSLSDMDAYSQSKLALIMWTYYLSETVSSDRTAFVAVNPGSLLASKMVKEGFGLSGKSLAIGAEILADMVNKQNIADYTGRYFDNDKSEFSLPHPYGINKANISEVIEALEYSTALLRSD